MVRSYACYTGQVKTSIQNFNERSVAEKLGTILRLVVQLAEFALCKI